MIAVATMSSGSLFQGGCGGGIDPGVFQDAADNWDAYINE